MARLASELAKRVMSADGGAENHVQGFSAAKALKAMRRQERAGTAAALLQRVRLLRKPKIRINVRLYGAHFLKA